MKEPSMATLLASLEFTFARPGEHGDGVRLLVEKAAAMSSSSLDDIMATIRMELAESGMPSRSVDTCVAWVREMVAKRMGLS